MCRAGSDINGNTLKPLFKKKEKEKKSEPLSNLEAWGSNLKSTDLELNPLDWDEKVLTKKKKKKKRKKERSHMCVF